MPLNLGSALSFSMWSIIFSTIYFLTLVFIIGFIIGENRSPIRALPWILVVILIPFAGIFLYLILGTNLKYKRLISTERFLNFLYSSKPQVCYEAPLSNSSLLEEDLIDLVFHLFNSSPERSQVDMFFSQGSYIESLIASISSAQAHIHIQYYEIQEEPFTRDLLPEIKKALARGVEVRIIYDDVGSRHTSNAFWRGLRKLGIEVYPFMRVYFPFLTQKVNYRNHKRIVIIDGIKAFIGCMDIQSKEYDSSQLNIVSGAQISLQGEVVHQVQNSFLVDWYIVSCQLIDGKRYYPISSVGGQFPDIISPQVVQVVSSSPSFRWNSIELVFSHIFQRAQQSICIETPVYLPTDAVHQAILSAALSGVDVQIILPEHSKRSFSSYASRSYFPELIQAGVSIYQSPITDRYAQYISIDHSVVLLGSSRLDFRCFENNFEINTLIYDTHLSQTIESHFQETWAISHLFELPSKISDHKVRYLFTRFTERFFRLFSPLM